MKFANGTIRTQFGFEDWRRERTVSATPANLCAIRQWPLEPHRLTGFRALSRRGLAGQNGKRHRYRDR